MTTNVPRRRSVRHLSAEEVAQLNDEQHVPPCDCPDCLPEAHEHDLCPVGADFGSGLEAA